MLVVGVAPGVAEIGFRRSLSILRVFRSARFDLEDTTVLHYELDRRRLYTVRIATTIVLIFFTAGGLVYSIEAGVDPDVDTF